MDIFIIACIIAGIIIGIFVCDEKTLKIFSKILFALMIILIFLIGFNIGNNKSLISSIGEIGFTSVGFAVSCAFFSFAATTFIFMFVKKRNKG